MSGTELANCDAARRLVRPTDHRREPDRAVEIGVAPPRLLPAEPQGLASIWANAQIAAPNAAAFAGGRGRGSSPT
jgi:hypothetical protein